MILSVLGGSLVVFPVFLLARRMFPERLEVARLAALLAMVQPFLVRYSGDAVADSLYTFVFTCTFVCAWRVLEFPRLVGGLLLGLGLGLGYLLRPEALGIAGVLAIGVVLRVLMLRQRGELWTGYLLKCSVVGLVTIVALMPFLATNMWFVHQKLGVWTLSPKAGLLMNFEKDPKRDILAELNADRTMTHHEAAMTGKGTYQEFSWQEFQEVPRSVRIQRYLVNWKEFLVYFFENLGAVPFVVFLLGMIFAFREARLAGAAGGAWATLVTLLFFAATLSVFYVSRRFLLPMFPLVLPWCGRGAIEVLDFIQARWNVRRGIGVAILLLLTSSQIVHHFGWHEARWRERPEQILGERLQQERGSGQAFVSAKGKVAWFADGQHLFLPSAPLDDIIVYMQKRNAGFLVLDHERRHRKVQLWEEVEAEPRLRKLDSERGRDKDFWVFELDNPK